MDHDTEAFVTTTRVALEQRKVVSQLVVTREARLSVSPDDLTDQLALRLESYVLAEKLVGDTKTVTGHLSFPSSPWQFFKQRHAGAWWLRWLVRRRPVALDRHRYERDVIFEKYAQYPEATLHTPELGRPVIIEQFSEPLRWRDF